jgi:tetratricopeptide (TPR) repeat protein
MKAYRLRARQWSRTAWIMAALFASLPLSSRVFLGSWSFEGAAGLAFLCLLAGTYWHIVARRHRELPDPAARLDAAMEAARAGRSARALELLTREIRVSPDLWQAYQYRGELYLMLGRSAEALADFDTAIRLAPEEGHLRALRDRAASPNTAP